MKFYVFFAATLFAAHPAQAGVIERACLKSDRAAVTRPLCGCIQEAADITLSYKDQRRASEFFRDPDKAQMVRQSSRSSDERFWQRYREFGSVAEAYCG